MGGLKAASPMAPQDQRGHLHSKGRQGGAGLCRPLSSEWAPGSSKPGVAGIWLQAYTHLSLCAHPPGSPSPSSSTRCSDRAQRGNGICHSVPCKYRSLMVISRFQQRSCRIKRWRKTDPPFSLPVEWKIPLVGYGPLSSYDSFWHSSASYRLHHLFPWAVDRGWVPLLTYHIWGPSSLACT